MVSAPSATSGESLSTVYRHKGLATRYHSRYGACFKFAGTLTDMELHIDEIARSLDLPARKVERWIRQGRIPLVRKGNICAFNRVALERWAADHDLCLELKEKAPAACTDDHCLPTLKEAMERGGVYHGIPGGGVPEVLESAVSALTDFEPDTRGLLLNKLLEREQLTSTGIGKGVAIPHPRDPLSGAFTEPRIATFFLSEPVDYLALDDQPVFVLFMLLCPAVKIHLHLLSRLSYCLRLDDFVHFLRTGPSAGALLRRVAAVEPQLDQTASPGL